MNKILVTGAAGFIGYHVCLRLLERGDSVIGVDNLNTYYDVSLKESRLANLLKFENFRFDRLDIAQPELISRLFAETKPDRAVNLAAQAGVRHSLLYPQDFIDSNVTGFLNILEGCRNHQVQHLVYASSSSVYGSNTEMPWSTGHNVDHPLSLYAASKKMNEMMAHSYSYLFRLPTTGIRFFNAYGPWGRPDMALFIFTKAIEEGRPINVYNYGKMIRDFTYVEDIAQGLVLLLDRTPVSNPDWDALHPDPSTSSAPFRIYNIGNHQPVEILEFIEILEECLGKKAQKNMMPMQLGDIMNSYAEVEDLYRDTGFRPATPVREGIKRFVDWYRSYYYSPAS